MEDILMVIYIVSFLMSVYVHLFGCYKTGVDKFFDIRDRALIWSVSLWVLFWVVIVSLIPVLNTLYMIFWGFYYMGDVRVDTKLKRTLTNPIFTGKE